jgi:2-oxoglutarate/2-oxoacid ferredoxin oxidoreductase subunit beta
MSESAIYKPPASLTGRQTHYCPGCGHGIIQKILAEVIDSLGIRERTISIAPVGCSVLSYFYFDFDVVEAAHGRAAAVATGLKRALPDRIVISYQGDGDLAAIGTAETIHAANRGENITVLFINNAVYGMTGGQMAPTTLPTQRTSTTPAGRCAAAMTGYPLRMCEMLNTLEPPYHIERVAIDGAQGAMAARRAIRTALQAQIAGNGYTFVELLSGCPVHQHLTPTESLEFVGQQMTRYFPVRIFRKEGKVLHA